jgi:hypothetical protein
VLYRLRKLTEAGLVDREDQASALTSLVVLSAAPQRRSTHGRSGGLESCAEFIGGPTIVSFSLRPIGT